MPGLEPGRLGKYHKATRFATLRDALCVMRFVKEITRLRDA
jgi:hypothetical protein